MGKEVPEFTLWSVLPFSWIALSCSIRTVTPPPTRATTGGSTAFGRGGLFGSREKGASPNISLTACFLTVLHLLRKSDTVLPREFVLLRPTLQTTHYSFTRTWCNLALTLAPDSPLREKDTREDAHRSSGTWADDHPGRVSRTLSPSKKKDLNKI